MGEVTACLYASLIREEKNDTEEEEYLQSDIPENVRRERILLIGGEISLR